jgi:adenylate cyclase
MKLALLLKKPMWLYAVASALAVTLMAVVSAVWAPQLLQWEERLASRTWALANQDATERRVVVVDIDEKSTQALGPWPWPRERVATLLSGLDAYGVNLKVVDVLFDGAQDPVQDQKLADALKAGAPTVIAQLFALSPSPSAPAPWPKNLPPSRLTLILRSCPLPRRWSTSLWTISTGTGSWTTPAM